MKGKDLKIKVCGITNQENLKAIELLGVDYVGNIFFEKSPRNLSNAVVAQVPKVGVFVKESVDKIMAAVQLHGLQVVQLHGGESNEVCKELSGLGAEVWKVFSVDDEFNVNVLSEFPAADFFLFDTKSPKHGGTGVKFDWGLLRRIDEACPKPYFLSGGIGPQDANEIKGLKLKRLVGLDLNSKFETVPGVKDVEALKGFLKELRMD